MIVFSTYDLGGFQSTDEASNLFTMRPDGRDRQQLTRYPPAGTRATQPSWTPNGKSIIFTKVDGSADEIRHVAFIRPDGSDLRELPLEGTHNRLQPYVCDAAACVRLRQLRPCANNREQITDSVSVRLGHCLEPSLELIERNDVR